MSNFWFYWHYSANGANFLQNCWQSNKSFALKQHPQCTELAWEKGNEVDVLFKMKVILVKSAPGYVKLSAPVNKVLVWLLWKLRLCRSTEKRIKAHCNNLKLLLCKFSSVNLMVCVDISMFLPLLDMIERAIINTFVGHDVVEPGNYVQMFPYPCYTRDEWAWSSYFIV